MHSTTLTEPIRLLHREAAFPALSRRTLSTIIERSAIEQLDKILAPKRKSEVRCPDCFVILSKQATSCYC